VEILQETPKLALAISTYNGRDRLLRCLASLLGQTLPSERIDAVVVVDGSTDGTVEAVRAMDFPFPLRVVEQPQLGLAAGRNRGVKESRGDVVCFFDDDMVATPGLLAAHASSHAGSSTPTVVCGYHPVSLSVESLNGRFLRSSWEEFFARKRHPWHRWTYVDWADGNSSMPIDLFHETGGFNERFGPLRRQDFEYAIRLLDRGVQFRFVPEARAEHYPAHGVAHGFKNLRYEGRADLILALLHPKVFSHLEASRVLKRAQFLINTTGALPKAVTRLHWAARIMDGLERTGMLELWLELGDRASREAYVVGVAEQAILEGGKDVLDALPLEAPNRAALQLATGYVEAHPHAGQLDLHCADAVGHSLPAIGPVEAWDSERIVERLGAGANTDVQLAEGLLRHLRSTRR
jgi:GT2 family glycosyltransferase